MGAVGHNFEHHRGSHTLRRERLAPVFAIQEVELKYSVGLHGRVITGDALYFG